MLCSAIPYYGCCDIMQATRFACIDKSDEHQLVSFILASKGFHFGVYGLLALAKYSYGYYSCVHLDIGEAHPCQQSAPGRALGYWRRWCSEEARVLLEWVAFLLLLKARGGRQQLAALERRRLGLSSSNRSFESPCAEGEDDTPSRGRKPGGFLRRLFVYDVAAHLCCLLLWLVQLWIKQASVDCTKVDCSQFLKAYNDGRPDWLKDWRLWVTLDFANTSYSLLLFPFVMLSLRSLRKYFIRSQATGYDRQGRLCIALTLAEIEERDAKLELAASEDMAAKAIQSRFRFRSQP